MREAGRQGENIVFSISNISSLVLNLLILFLFYSTTIWLSVLFLQLSKVQLPTRMLWRIF